jgi:hypothetical protein
MMALTHLNTNTGRTLHHGVHLFPRETRRGEATAKSNAFTLSSYQIIVDTQNHLWHIFSIKSKLLSISIY